MYEYDLTLTCASFANQYKTVKRVMFAKTIQDLTKSSSVL